MQIYEYLTLPPRPLSLVQRKRGFTNKIILVTRHENCSLIFNNCLNIV